MPSRPLPTPAVLAWPTGLYLLLLIAALASTTGAQFSPDNTVEQSIRNPPADRRDVSYEPEFVSFDRSLIGRAPAGVTALSNNGPQQLNLDPGKTACYMVEKSAIFGSATKESRDVDAGGQAGESKNPALGLRPRADESKRIYISANTCLQPYVRTKGGNHTAAPQLSIHISTAKDAQCPDGSQDSSKIHSLKFEEGAAMYSIKASDDIYIGITAPNITHQFDQTYNFEVAMSLDSFYHSYDSAEKDPLMWMDSDSSSAILVTKNLTQNEAEAQSIMTEQPPYDLFVDSQNSTTMDGLRHSVCGLKNYAKISINHKSILTTVMTRRGPGNLPKQQFHFIGLNSSSSYTAILVKKANETEKAKRDGIGGGGVVFRASKFSTETGTSCKVVTDLEFCDQVQWAVPGNDDEFNNKELAKIYDDYAKEMYGYFETVLQQIPCEVPVEQRWSLARDCKDCKDAYKRWLCTVAVPRCVDFNSNMTGAFARNIQQAFPNGTKLPESMRRELGKNPAHNTSRNAFIDDKIKPGPYREVLPCEEVCYEVVQSCPAGIGLQCPLPGMTGFEATYGRRNRTTMTCNYPGDPRITTSAAAGIGPHAMLLGFAMSLMMWLAL